MISNLSIQGKFPIKTLRDVADFLDSRRRPITASDRISGPYPYYGANGQQNSVNGYIFDEPLILLAEDGGMFDQPDRGIAYPIQAYGQPDTTERWLDRVCAACGSFARLSTSSRGRNRRHDFKPNPGFPPSPGAGAHTGKSPPPENPNPALDAGGGVEHPVAHEDSHHSANSSRLQRGSCVGRARGGSDGVEPDTPCRPNLPAAPRNPGQVQNAGFCGSRQGHLRGFKTNAQYHP